MAAVIQLPQRSFRANHNNPPVRQRNRASRTREYLTADEIERMITAVRQGGGRFAERDCLLIMMGYRHGFRASELAALQWDQVDLKAGDLHVTRMKEGSSATHPLRGPELRALRAWKRAQGESGRYVFTSHRGGPLDRRTVHHVIAKAGKAAGIEFPVHPHMLRHACGYYLANTGQDTRAIQAYLGHKNIFHTTRYTELAPTRFRNFWKD
jgi:integrase